MVTDINGDEAVKEPVTMQEYNGGTYDFDNTCASNCKRFWIYLGDAFDPDKLYFAFANKEPVDGYTDINGVRWRLTVRVELSYIRNPPSTKALNGKHLKASIRVATDGTPHGIDSGTLSTEAVTPFPDSNSDGWQAVEPADKADPTASVPNPVTASLMIGLGVENYKGAKFKFNMRLVNPIPQKNPAKDGTGGGYIVIKANHAVFFTEDAVNEPHYAKTILRTIPPTLSGIATNNGDATGQSIKIPEELFDRNLYRGDELEFTIGGLQTAAFAQSPMTFTIETHFKEASGAGDKHMIDKYTDIQVIM